jgi:hypothetical protein
MVELSPLEVLLALLGRLTVTRRSLVAPEVMVRLLRARPEPMIALELSTVLVEPEQV